MLALCAQNRDASLIVHAFCLAALSEQDARKRFFAVSNASLSTQLSSALAAADNAVKSGADERAIAALAAELTQRRFCSEQVCDRHTASH